MFYESFFRYCTQIMAVVALLSCSETENLEIKYRGLTMGTSWSVKVNSIQAYSPELAEKIQSELDDVNNRMSSWLDSSDVSRFNKLEVGTCIDISESTKQVIHTSLSIAELSNGAFDISLSPVIDLWGFGSTFHISELPPEELIGEALDQTGVENMRLTENKLCKENTNIQLNLSAIAKGYGVDKVADLLDREGHTDYLIEVGGELRAKGKNGRGTQWTVGIEQPVYDLANGTVQTAMPLSDASVATSGDYRNFFEVDGTRYSHIINPVTGYPVSHNAASVTVVANTAMEADAWATALLVLGPDEGINIANKYELRVFMIVSDQEELSVITSEHW